MPPTPSLPVAFDTSPIRGHTPNLRTPTDIPTDDLCWGFRVCRPDFTSSRDFRWPFPGEWATAASPNPTNPDPCPSEPGDGVCAALTWAGAASGNISAGHGTVLVVCWHPDDVLSPNPTDKVRLRRAFVSEVVDVRRFAVPRANLYGANLSRANLSGVDLSRADLSGAYLSGADLYGANLSRAHLYGVDLSGAYLSRAHLYGVDLSGAYLSGADLYGANLYGADLGDWKISADGLASR